MPPNPLRSSVRKVSYAPGPSDRRTDVTGFMHVTLNDPDLRPVTYRIPEKNWKRFAAKHAGSIVCAVTAEGKVKRIPKPKNQPHGGPSQP